MQRVMRRRDVLKLMASLTASPFIFQACATGSPRREFKIESPVNIPEESALGSDNWYASVCTGCAAGCGIVARVFEARAKKIEGNPNHPLNQGGLCARGQAAVQDLYHPDRIQTPLRRRGERGAGDFEPIGWDDALDELLSRLRADGQGGRLVMLTKPLSGAARLVADRFSGALGGRRLSFDTLDQTTLRAAVARVFGVQRLPAFDIANARFVLSFGADFLHTWISPVQFARDYGAFRQARPGLRGTLYQVETRMSGTAANADRWIPVAPGAEGALALAIARVIRDEGLAAPGAGATLDALEPLLEDAAPEQVADATGVAADTIRDIARRFAGGRPGIALGGGSAAAHSNGLFNLTAIYALNLLVGNVNQPGGVLLPSAVPDALAAWQPDAPPALDDWSALVDDMRAGGVGALLLRDANPVYGLPPAAGFADALANVPSVVSFSRYIDETTAHADLVLPDQTGLESWGAIVPQPGAGMPVVGFQQPVVAPFYQTRAFVDVLLTAAEELGGAALEALPWNTSQELVRDMARQLQQADGGAAQTDDFERYWVELLQQGVWSPPSTPARPAPASNLTLQPAAPQFAGGPDEFPFHLLPYPSATLRAGEYAFLPWLQALPDPIVTGTWGTWVELNMDDADRLGVGIGDIMRVVTPQGNAEVPVYVHPAAPPGVAAIPMGQGHHFFGRYAKERGVNPLELVAPLADADTGALAWAATRARLEKTGRQTTLTRFEGSTPTRAPADYPIIRVTRVDD